MKKRKTYQQEALKLAKAFEIGIEAYTHYPPKGYGAVELKDLLTFLEGWQQACLAEDPPFHKTIKSLSFLKPILFEYFQEEQGATVEYFWKRIQEEQLDFERQKAPLYQIILEKGSINNRQEYNYITDHLLALSQEGKITPKEFKQLDEMLGNYED